MLTKNLSFRDDDYRLQIDGGYVAFVADLNGVRVVNRVFEETLRECCDAVSTKESAEATFVKYWRQFQDIARQIIESGNVNDLGGADITPDAVRRSAEQFQ